MSLLWHYFFFFIPFCTLKHQLLSLSMRWTNIKRTIGQFVITVDKLWNPKNFFRSYLWLNKEANKYGMREKDTFWSKNGYQMRLTIDDTFLKDWRQILDDWRHILEGKRHCLEDWRHITPIGAKIETFLAHFRTRLYLRDHKTHNFPLHFTINRLCLILLDKTSLIFHHWLPTIVPFQLIRKCT